MIEIVADIPRIYTAIAEWQACLIYIALMRRRFTGWRLIGILLGGFILQSSFLIGTGMLPLVFWVPCMALAVLNMILFVYICCDLHLRDATYYGIRGLVLAEFIASFVWQVYSNTVLISMDSSVLKGSMIMGLYLVIGLGVWSLEKRHMLNQQPLNVTNWELWSAILMGVVIFTISNLSFVSGRMIFSSQYPREIMNIRTLVDVGGYAMLYAHHVLCIRTRAWCELEATQNILQNQYVQYKQSRESIDLINQKYHDLKHQIEILRHETDPEKRNVWLDEMEQDIQMHEAQYKTGNHVIDTILMGKSLYCQKHGILMTCVVDGTLLDFMSTMDLCSIFGNALDNAIECVEKNENHEKRLIHVSVFSKKSFVIIRFENYYEGDLIMANDLPMTTKNEEFGFHGYGLKSIRHTVQKYGGTINIRLNENWFELKILFNT